jgi:hypothetical protein
MTLHSHPESAQPAANTGVPLPTDLNVSSSKALAAIVRFIGDPPDNSRVYEINPSMAQYLLDRYNIANRPTKPAKIALYGETMAKQEWRLTGDTVKFSDRGILRDGQNRLMACVRSGTPFTTHVVFGIDDSFFNVMDQGKNRDGSDLLAIAGVANSTIVAGAVRWAHLYETGTIMQRTTLPPPEVLRLYQERYHHVVNFVSHARATYNHTKWPAGFIAGSLYHLARIDGKAAHDFAHAMANNNFTGRYLPLAKMNSQLAGIAGVSSGRINDVVRAALLIICWNLVRDNKKGKQKDFQWNDKLPFPVAK